MESTEKNKGKFVWLEKAHEHYRLGQYRDVILACNQALQFDSTFDRAHLGRGLAFYELNDFDMALSALNRTVRCNPKNIKAYLVKGDIYCKRKQYKKALMAYNRVLQIDSNNIDAQTGKERAKISQAELNKQNYKSVEDPFPKIENVDEPHDPRLYEYISKGDEYSKVEKYEEALGSYIQALQIEQDNRDALRGKARALLKLGRYKEAHEAYSLLQPSRVIGLMVPYSWGFKERPQSDFYKW
jgi:tetratricopeptide (TPR) repeat protein